MCVRRLVRLYDRTVQLLDRLNHQDRTQADNLLTVVENGPFGSNRGHQGHPIEELSKACK